MHAFQVGSAVLLLALVAGPRAPVAEPPRGPTVVIEPGDVTPLRGNIRNPLGPSQVYAPFRPLPSPAAEALERDLRRELGRLPSRPVVPEHRQEGPRDLIDRPRGPDALPAVRDATDRARARAALEAFKSLRPNAPATPTFEHDLDRLERPTDLGR